MMHYVRVIYYILNYDSMIQITSNDVSNNNQL